MATLALLIWGCDPKEFGPMDMKLWQDTVIFAQDKSEPEKLEIVNRLFNGKMRYVHDIDLWKVREYWATPAEFIKKGAGDCEDFAIAKYFLLRDMSVDESKLRLAYCETPDGPHMVLAYYANPNMHPVILDNMIDEIVPLPDRARDLMMVTSFNQTSLWSIYGKKINASRLKAWRDVQRRMAI